MKRPKIVCDWAPPQTPLGGSKLPRPPNRLERGTTLHNFLNVAAFKRYSVAPLQHRTN